MFRNKEMAERLDPIFPEAGGLERLNQVRHDFSRKLDDPKARAGRTSFHPQEAEHFRKMFRLLGSDDEAKATLMSWLAFAQMKNDCAGW